MGELPEIVVEERGKRPCGYGRVLCMQFLHWRNAGRLSFAIGLAYNNPDAEHLYLLETHRIALPAALIDDTENEFENVLKKFQQKIKDYSIREEKKLQEGIAKKKAKKTDDDSDDPPETEEAFHNRIFAEGEKQRKANKNDKTTE